MNMGKKFRELKLVQFLDRIDLAMTLFWIIWALIMVYASIFVEYNSFIIEIPNLVSYVGLGIVILLAIIVKIYCSQDKTDPVRKYVFFGWNAVLPFIYNIIILINLGALYNFGGFLGGLANYVIRIANIILAVLFVVIYFLAQLIKRKMAAKGKTIKTEKVQMVKSVLNVIIFVAFCIALIILSFVWVIEGLDYMKVAKDEERTNAFRQEMMDKLPEYSNTYNEAKLSVWTVESMAEGSSYDMDAENGNVFSCTTVSQEVFDSATVEYKKFIAENRLDKPFSEEPTENSELFCYEDRTVHICFSVYCKTSGNKDAMATMVCKYDENWNLVKIYVRPYMITKKNRE